MKKVFECVEMKRAAQERIYHETTGLSRERKLEYFHRAADEFRKEIRQLREARTSAGPDPGDTNCD